MDYCRRMAKWSGGFGSISERGRAEPLGVSNRDESPPGAAETAIRGVAGVVGDTQPVFGRQHAYWHQARWREGQGRDRRDGGDDGPGGGGRGGGQARPPWRLADGPGRRSLLRRL